MNLFQIFEVGFVVLLTHAIQAVTGFGCAVLALPFVTAILGVKTGIPLLAVLGWALALYIVVTKWKSIIFREFAIIVFFVGLGLPIGIIAFRALDPFSLKRILALFIISVSGWKLLLPLVSKNRKTESTKSCCESSALKLPKVLAFFLLFLGGIFHGAFASGGPLVVLYAASALPDKGHFRATLNMLWLTVNTILMVNYALSGIVNSDVNKGVILMLPFLITGIFIGEKIHDKVHSDHFEPLIFGVLGITGILMLVLS